MGDEFGGELEEVGDGLLVDEVFLILFESLKFFGDPDFILNSGELIETVDGSIPDPNIAFGEQFKLSAKT